MTPTITALYAAPLILLFFVLTMRVMVLRFPKQVMIGTGGDPVLERATRVHANFTEYVPLFLVALTVAELCGAAPWALHAAGAAMLAGRLCHALGVSRTPDILALRGLGMLLTLGALIAAGALALAAALRAG
jgi:uncharacterized membrane protein YecN with MAPEG domain